ncbi:MAG: lactate racemase domain-containing protein, partial [Deltaproteobacteria bacterium]|nr:lactate racemase domain-containing protein [Deltaproteobacteria bacterium]
MKTVAIPYHTTTIDLHVPEPNLAAVITGAKASFDPGKEEVAVVREALANPVSTPRLRDLARDKNKVVLITGDHTRPMSCCITLPVLLEEIRTGNPKADVTILVGTGLNRPTTEAEQRAMFGDDVVRNEKIAVNDAYDAECFEYQGRLPSGAVFYVNKLVTECDLLVAEGVIE